MTDIPTPMPLHIRAAIARQGRVHNPLRQALRDSKAKAMIQEWANISYSQWRAEGTWPSDMSDEEMDAFERVADEYVTEEQVDGAFQEIVDALVRQLREYRRKL